eukprot:Rmarinus@m.18891
MMSRWALPLVLVLGPRPLWNHLLSLQQSPWPQHQHQHQQLNRSRRPPQQVRNTRRKQRTVQCRILDRLRRRLQWLWEAPNLSNTIPRLLLIVLLLLFHPLLPLLLIVLLLLFHPL